MLLHLVWVASFSSANQHLHNTCNGYWATPPLLLLLIQHYSRRSVWLKVYFCPLQWQLQTKLNKNFLKCYVISLYHPNQYVFIVWLHNDVWCDEVTKIIKLVLAFHSLLSKVHVVILIIYQWDIFYSSSWVYHCIYTITVDSYPKVN